MLFPARNSSVLLRFVRSLDSANSEEYRSKSRDFSEDCLVSLKETNTLNHSENFCRNLPSFLGTCCHFFCKLCNNLCRTGFILSDRVKGHYNLTLMNFLISTYVTVALSFKWPFIIEKISSFLGHMLHVHHRQILKLENITSI